MAWVDGEERRVFVVDASYDQVVAFFCDPAKFKDAFSEMDRAQEIETGVWHWTLREKAEKGIRFTGNYRVKYVREGDTLRWSTLEGNMRSSGTTTFRDLNGKTEVTYHESLATDLPIPGLMAKVFKPIVGREIASGIGKFLDRGKALIEGK